MRALLIKVAAGERIPPEFIRVALAGCLKVACLRTVVKTIPTKENLGQLSGSRRVVVMKVCLCTEMTKIIKTIDIYAGIFYLNRLSNLERLVIK